MFRVVPTRYTVLDFEFNCIGVRSINYFKMICFCCIFFLISGMVHSPFLVDMFPALKKIQVGNAQEMAQSERNSHSINRGLGKN